MLNSEQIEKIKVVLATEGWNDVILPVLRGRAFQAVEALKMTASKRAANFKGSDYDVEDDSLRAMVLDIEWLMRWMSSELKAHEHNRQLEELERQEAAAGNP